jgi:DNA gyrase subunit A
MNLEPGDSLVDARAASDKDDAIIVTSDGQAMRFSVGSLRVASRASGGVRGVRLRRGATVVAGVIDADGEDLLVISERGMGKRTPLEEYPTKGRGGGGVVTFRVTSRSGPLAVARAVRPEQELIVVSTEGIVMRTRTDTISRYGRSTQGVHVMNVGDSDRVSASAVIDLSNAPGSTTPPAGDDGDDDDAPDGAPGAPDAPLNSALGEEVDEAEEVGGVDGGEGGDELDGADEAGDTTDGDAPNAGGRNGTPAARGRASTRGSASRAGGTRRNGSGRGKRANQ